MCHFSSLHAVLANCEPGKTVAGRDHLTVNPSVFACLRLVACTSPERISAFFDAGAYAVLAASACA
jgi:hypothetical protein